MSLPWDEAFFAKAMPTLIGQFAYTIVESTNFAPTGERKENSA